MRRVRNLLLFDPGMHAAIRARATPHRWTARSAKPARQRRPALRTAAEGGTA